MKTLPRLPFGIALCVAVLLVVFERLGLSALGALLVLLLPGLIAAHRLYVDPGERLVLGIGLGFAIAVIAAMAIVGSPVAFNRWSLLAVFGLLSLALLAGFSRSQGQPSPTDTRLWLALAAIAIIAGGARIVGTWNSELMGDEAKVLLWATDVLQGREDILLLHRKGPAEILLTATYYGLLGRTSEFTARAPFLLASVAAVLGIFVCGSALFDRRIGFIAGLLAAIDGFLIGFGRMIQYPSLILCLGISSVFAAYRFYQSGRMRYCFGAGLLMAGLVLCHWDFIWIGPVVLLALAAAWRRHALGWRGGLLAAALALGQPLLTLAAFYIPYVSGPSFGFVQSYLGDRVAGRGYDLRDNLSSIATYAIIYNSVYYALAVGCLLVLSVTRVLPKVGWRQHRHKVWWAVLSALLAIALVVIDPDHLLRAGGLWALLILLFYILLSEQDLADKASWAWFLVPFAAYSFAIKKPLLSIYNFVPGAVLLAAQVVESIRQRISNRTTRRAFIAGLLAVYALSAGYTWLAFCQQQPEYIRTFPAHETALYWTPFGDVLPDNAGCGFPHRAGWKAIGALYAQGTLQGDYWSNEEELITHWYTRGAIRCVSDPQYVFLAEYVKDAEEGLPDMGDYSLIGQVLVEGEETIAIWQRGAERRELISYVASDYAATFDATLSTPDLFTNRPRTDYMADVPAPLAIQLGDEMVLRGVKLPATPAEAGDSAEILLYWEALSAEEPDLRISLQLTALGRTWAQEDCVVDCGLLDSGDWYAGRLFIGRYSLPLPANLAASWYTLGLGAYRFEWNEGRKEAIRVPVHDPAGQAWDGERLTLGKLQVGEPQALTPRYSLDAVFGDRAGLFGVDVASPTVAPGDMITITLFWRCLGTFPDGYTVFLHVVDAQGAIVAQKDSPPQQGQNPTWLWVPGEIVVDPYDIMLPDSLSPGSYMVSAGLYLPSTGERLSAVSGEGATSDHVQIARLVVE